MPNDHGIDAPEGHVAAMLAKSGASGSQEEPQGSTQEAPKSTAEERPEWLPEKFKDPASLAKAYAELEKKLSQTKEAPAEDTPEDPQGDGEETAADATSADEAQETVEKAGLDFNAMTAEYLENGNLSDDTYASLEKAGIHRATVDAYVAGQQALAAQMVQQAYEQVGGKEEWDGMVNWAKDNLSKPQIEAFNQAMEGSAETREIFISGLYSKYTSSGSREPNLVSGDTPSTDSTGSFASMAEMKAAMSDPRYAKDPAYRDSVARKLARSNI